MGPKLTFDTFLKCLDERKLPRLSYEEFLDWLNKTHNIKAAYVAGYSTSRISDAWNIDEDIIIDCCERGLT